MRRLLEIIGVRKKGGLDQGINSGNGEKRLDSEHILKEEPTRFLC